MVNYPHKDPEQDDDDDLIELARQVFADPVPEMEVPGFGRRLAQIIQRGLGTAAKHLPRLPRHDRDTDQSRPLRLTLRLTGFSPPVDRNQLDYEVIEDGRSIGRLYEDLRALPELRWFWSINALVGHRPDMKTTGRAPTLDLAKARFLKNWQKCRDNNRPHHCHVDGRPKKFNGCRFPVEVAAAILPSPCRF